MRHWPVDESVTEVRTHWYLHCPNRDSAPHSEPLAQGGPVTCGACADRMALAHLCPVCTLWTTHRERRLPGTACAC